MESKGETGATGTSVVFCPLTCPASAGHDQQMHIFKIFRAEEFAAFEAAGTTRGAPIDVRDGYIHFSTATQVAETVAKHFDGEDDLVLLAVEADLLGDDLRWEPSRGGQLFPHLYRDLRRSDVVWLRPLTLGLDGHRLPDLTT